MIEIKPSMEAAYALAFRFAKMKETILKSEISKAIGDRWIIADLKGRLRSVVSMDGTVETILLDGNPIVEFHQVEFETVNEDGKVFIKATSQYRTLQQRNPGCSCGKNEG